jgi:hypothetical protein
MRMTPQIYKAVKRCDIKGCRKGAPHKMRVASSSTKKITYLHYCDFHYADLYSGVFMGENLINKKR